ncbi:MAG: hypothetical protein F4Y00_03705 [Bacteroidetes bacterium SB0662_bin_6]|nr:hypothetical protein [Bacteroidetes bacterium SB0668_bin_1]MYE04060.1 hypothetical protein [Bacteroidetes bacterium SB0662_bin_6]
MQSIELLPDLEQIPLRAEHGGYGYEEVVKRSGLMRNDLFAIEVAAGIEGVLSALVAARNVSDADASADLLEAYRLASPDAAAEVPLYEEYNEVLARGPESVGGFISNIKGKLAEIRVQGHLEKEFPDYSFEIAVDQNQPVWDILSTSPDGTETLIQVKIGGEEYAGEVITQIQDNPDVLFAVGNEIRATVLQEYPELSGQFVDLELSNYELTGEVGQDLELLAQSSGIDVPDEIVGLIPFATEITLGAVLLSDIVKTERGFKEVAMDERKRVHAMKALVLFQRFGISAVLTTAGGAAGTLVAPGPGSAIGAIGGALSAWRLNRKLRPRMRKIGMALTGVTEDVIFYLRNKAAIDRIGESFSRTAASI